MPSPTLLLIRHGQTAWNVQRRVLGRTDIPLDAEGRAQAARLPAAVGPVAAVWTSPLSRARDTAVGLVPAGGVLQVEADLTEMDQGEMDGCGPEEMRARFGDVLHRWNVDPADERLPGGETMAEVQARGLAALARIAAASAPGARVAVVSHQLVISAVLCALRDEPLSRWRTHAHRNTAWSELRWGTPPVVVAEQVSAHLPPTG